jgi:hypothetical protein
MTLEKPIAIVWFRLFENSTISHDACCRNALAKLAENSSSLQKVKGSVDFLGNHRVARCLRIDGDGFGPVRGTRDESS